MFSNLSSIQASSREQLVNVFNAPDSSLLCYSVPDYLFQPPLLSGAHIGNEQHCNGQRTPSTVNLFSVSPQSLLMNGHTNTRKQNELNTNDNSSSRGSAAANTQHPLFRQEHQVPTTAGKSVDSCCNI